MRNPSMTNFARSLKNSWEKQTKAPIKWSTLVQTPETTFVIRHFTSDVRYATVCQLYKTIGKREILLKDND